jgi:hypothetical protein
MKSVCADAGYLNEIRDEETVKPISENYPESFGCIYQCLRDLKDIIDIMTSFQKPVNFSKTGKER